jgi:hypothetical protein
MKPRSILFILLFFCFIISCATPADVTEGNTLSVELEIVPFSAIPETWDSLFYQHDTSWPNPSNTSHADSLANALARSGAKVADLWYPDAGNECMMLFLNGSDVIVRLSHPGAEINELGFQQATSFSVSCVSMWRHYKFTKSAGSK